MALRGSLKEMSLTSLISVNCNEHSRSRLRLRSHGREGMLFFEDGNVVHAMLDSHEAEAAVYELLSWEDGEFELEMHTASISRTIHAPWSSLLLDAMARLDERALEASPQTQDVREAVPGSNTDGASPPEEASAVQPTVASAAESLGGVAVWPLAGTVATESALADTWMSGTTLAVAQAPGHPALSYVHTSPSEPGGTPRSRSAVTPAPSHRDETLALGSDQLLESIDEPESRVPAYNPAAPKGGQAFIRLVRPPPAQRLACDRDDDTATPERGDVLSMAQWAPDATTRATHTVESVLGRICRMEGVEGALLVARDGTLLSYHWGEGGTDSDSSPGIEDAAEQAAAVVVFVGNAARDMGDALRLGALTSGVVETGAGRNHILVLERPEYFVGLRLGLRASPALVAAHVAPLLADIAPMGVSE